MYDPFYVIPDLNTHLPSATGSPMSVFTDAEGNILCRNDVPVLTGLPSDTFDCTLPPGILIGSSDNTNWQVYRIPDKMTLPSGCQLVPLRSIAASLSRDLMGILGRAIQLSRFDLITSYCGKCGTSNRMKDDELAKTCPSCGLLTFPRLSPAVIVRITDGDKILLARSPHFPSGMYSVLAGFIEPGESLEAGVHREIFEEIGVKITDLNYFGSQPWPFPDSLMIGFTARFKSGEIRCDGVEIEDADWYTRDRMPGLPGPFSIAHALIDGFISGNR